MKLLFSPHDDDFALFAAFTCLRESPVVVTVLDSYIQPARGEIGCSASERAEETRLALGVLNCVGQRFRLRDDDVTLEQIVAKMKTLANDILRVGKIDVVYAPALQGGNEHHDMVSQAVGIVFDESIIIKYTTYSKTELYTTSNIEVTPNLAEVMLKKRALDCFESQLRINMQHFLAVKGMKSEFLDKHPLTTYPSSVAMNPDVVIKADHKKPAPSVTVQAKINTTFPEKGKMNLVLGCGKKFYPGCENTDRLQLYLGVRKVDATHNLPYSDNTFDHVFSEDFMEHIPAEKGIHVINEIWRVLKPGGIMEHIIPNAGSQNDFGSPSHLSHWNLQCFKHFDVDSYRYEKDKDHEEIAGGFKYVYSDLLNPMLEPDGIVRHQAIHVKYAAVKEC